MNIPLILGLIGLISGEKLIDALWAVLIWALVFGVLWWLLHVIAPKEPWNKVATVILAVLTAVVLINILLGLAGHPIIRW